MTDRSLKDITVKLNILRSKHEQLKEAYDLEKDAHKKAKASLKYYKNKPSTKDEPKVQNGAHKGVQNGAREPFKNTDQQKEILKLNQALNKINNENNDIKKENDKLKKIILDQNKKQTQTPNVPDSNKDDKIRKLELALAVLCKPTTADTSVVLKLKSALRKMTGV